MRFSPSNSGRHKKILRQYGTVAKLVELLSHNASPDVQEAAARAIRGVVRDSARSVGDKVTGVDINSSGPTTCIKQCNDQYKLLFDQEQKLLLVLIVHLAVR